MVQAPLAGDAAAVEALSARLKCVPRQLSVLNARRGGWLRSHDLEDLTQEVLLRIWQKLGTYEGHVTLEFWTHRFCLLELMNKIRKRSRASSLATSDDVESVPQPDSEGGGSIEPQVLEEAIGGLRPDFRDCVRLRAFEQKDFDEIGELLSIPAATAKSRYYRGLKGLRDALQRKGEGGES